MTSKVWDVMNDLEMVTSKIVSAREIIDAAVDAIQEHDHDKAETLAMAAYEFLGYYLDEFDEKFKLAWKETVVAENEVERSKYYYEYDRNDLNRPNPFVSKNGVMYKDYVNAKINAESHWNDGWTREHYQKIVDKYEGKKETLSCDKDDPSPECKGAWNSFWEENYYPNEHRGSTVSSVPKDKVVKWRLPVEMDGPSGEYYVQFPDDLLEAANLKEGDTVEWVDRGDGSYLLRKTTRPLGMDEC